MRTNGIVIREREAAAGTKLITLLTAELGVINAFVSGAGSPKSKSVSSTDLLCYSDFSLEKNKKGNFYIKEATPVNVFFELRRDIVTLCLAQYLCELTGELAPREEKAGEFLPLILNSLHLLCEGKKEQRLIKAAAELRMLSLSGYMPQLIGCSKCGVYEGEKMYVDTFTGELFCDNCKGTHKALPISSGALAAMRHICLSDAGRIFSFNLPAEALMELGSIAEKYLISITAKKFKTLDFYKTMTEF